MNIVRKLPVKKSPMHSSQSRFNKHANGSAEHRDENNRTAYNKKSKEKIPKHPSTTLLKPIQQDTLKRPGSFATNIHQYRLYSFRNVRQSAANVPEIEFSLVDSKEDYKAKYYNTLRELELSDSHKIGKSCSHKQFATEG